MELEGHDTACTLDDIAFTGAQGLDDAMAIQIVALEEAQAARATVGVLQVSQSCRMPICCFSPLCQCLACSA